jgi:hypothetical protein
MEGNILARPRPIMPGLPSIPDVIALREVDGMARPLAAPDSLVRPAFVVGAIPETCPPGEGALRV